MMRRFFNKEFSYNRTVDKAGNRTAYQHQNGQGMQQYGPAFNYNSWTYDEMGRLTQIQDTNRNYTATVTNDRNGNNTQVGEVIPGTLNVTSTFSYPSALLPSGLSLGVEDRVVSLSNRDDRNLNPIRTRLL